MNIELYLLLIPMLLITVGGTLYCICCNYTPNNEHQNINI